MNGKQLLLLIALLIAGPLIAVQEGHVREHPLVIELATKVTGDFSVAQLNECAPKLSDARSDEIDYLRSVCKSYQKIVNIAFELHQNPQLDQCVARDGYLRIKTENEQRRKHAFKTGAIICGEEADARLTAVMVEQNAIPPRQLPEPVVEQKPIQEEDSTTKRAREIYQYTNSITRKHALESALRTLRTIESHIGAAEACAHVDAENKRLNDLQDALRIMIVQKETEKCAAASPTMQKYASSKE